MIRYTTADTQEIPRTLTPALIRLINHHSGDSMFLISLQTLCRYLKQCCRVCVFGGELINRTLERSAFADEAGDFRELTKDYDARLLSPQILSGTIAIINRILASNMGIETFS